MIVVISNLIRITIPALLINVTLNLNISSAQTFEFKDSFFPLIPGSYWVNQDTFFDREAEIAAQEGGMNPFTTKTDSVKQIISTSGGLKIQMISRIGKKRKDETCYEYFINNKGFVSEFSINNKLVKRILPQWKLFPEKDDTVFENGSPKRILVYGSTQTDSIRYLLPIWKSENPACEPAIYLLEKGVGLIGQIYSFKANRLIEYRIGNGPIIKKRWIMESPKRN
jgi:hypothetical protein